MLLARVKRLLATIVASWGFVAMAGAEVVYHPEINSVVRGSWILAGDGPIELFPNELAFDLDGNASSDISLQHGYNYIVAPAPDELLPYVRTALEGLHAYQSHLKRVYAAAYDSATLREIDRDRLRRNQLEADQALNQLHQIAFETRYERLKLLDGSAGLTASTMDYRLNVLHVGRGAIAGQFDVTVQTPALRATLEATVKQTQPLARDEQLNLNSFDIPLSKGMSQLEVIQRINEFQDYTGTSADNRGTDGATRLVSRNSGSAITINAVSNRAPSTDSNGFSTNLGYSSGTDIVVDVNGQTIAGTGNIINVSEGPAAGLSFRVEYDWQSDPAQTYVGSVGRIVTEDHSLVARYPSGALHRVTLPDVSPYSVGTGIVGNLFRNLLEIQVDQTYYALDALGVVEASEQQIASNIAYLTDLAFGVPVSESRVASNGITRFLLDESGTGLITPGTWIGPNSQPADSSVDLLPSIDGFVGVEFGATDGVHYGWLHVSTDHDRGIVLRDAAFESEPGRPIQVGIVPEPALGSLSLFCGALGLLVFRRARSLIQPTPLLNRTD